MSAPSHAYATAEPTKSSAVCAGPSGFGQFVSATTAATIEHTTNIIRAPEVSRSASGMPSLIGVPRAMVLEVPSAARVAAHHIDALVARQGHDTIRRHSALGGRRRNPALKPWPRSARGLIGSVPARRFGGGCETAV